MMDTTQEYLMRLQQEVRDLDELRCAMVMLDHGIRKARRDKVDDTKILDGVLNAIRRNMNKYNRKSSGVIA